MLDLCIDARMAFSSGIGTCIQEIVPLFRNSPFRVILLVDKAGRQWCKEFEQIVFTAPIYSVQEQLLFPLKVPKCDLFWSPHYNVPLFPIRAKKRIFTLHDICHLIFGTFVQKTYAKQVIRTALRLSDRAITVSHFSKKETEQYFPKSYLEVIPISVNRLHFSPRSACDKVKAKYKLPQRFVLFIGNQKPHKNVEGLKCAFSKIKDSSLELVILGKGTERGLIDKEDLPIVYSMAEAFVFPSFYEGFGLPPLEAMSCGCPTIVSSAASIPEVCGDASFYFNPNKQEEITKAILKVIGDPQLKKDLIERGFKRVKQYSWEETAKRYLEIFERVCFEK